MIRRLILKSPVILTAAALAGPVVAMQSSLAAGPDEEADEMPAVLTSPEHPLAAGSVVATDRNAGTIEIRYRPNQTLDLAYLTMVFRVADTSLLTGLTAGDKIRFQIEREGRSYVITRIENSN